MVKAVPACIAFLLMLALAGCISPPKVDASQLVGHWSSGDGADLTLNADGTLEVVGVPADVWNPALWAPSNMSGRPEGEEVRADAHWRLLDRMPDVSGQVVEINTDGAVNFALVRGGSTITIAFVLGDPDNHDFYEFEKQPQ